MKHLAQIQSEFIKFSSDISWWEDMNDEAQTQYLKDHPESRMRPTPRHENPEVMRKAREHAHAVVQELIKNKNKEVPSPGDDSEEGQTVADAHIGRVHNYDVFPGRPKVWHRGHPLRKSKGTDRVGDNVIFKKDDKIFDTDDFIKNRNSKPLNEDEAVSKIREEYGHNDYDDEYVNKVKDDRMKAMNEYGKEHAKKYGPNSSPWD